MGIPPWKYVNMYTYIVEVYRHIQEVYVRSIMYSRISVMYMCAAICKLVYVYERRSS